MSLTAPTEGAQAKQLSQRSHAAYLHPKLQTTYLRIRTVRMVPASIVHPDCYSKHYRESSFHKWVHTASLETHEQPRAAMKGLRQHSRALAESSDSTGGMMATANSLSPNPSASDISLVVRVPAARAETSTHSHNKNMHAISLMVLPLRVAQIRDLAPPTSSPSPLSMRLCTCKSAFCLGCGCGCGLCVRGGHCSRFPRCCSRGCVNSHTPGTFTCACIIDKHTLLHKTARLTDVALVR